MSLSETNPSLDNRIKRLLKEGRWDTLLAIGEPAINQVLTEYSKSIVNQILILEALDRLELDLTDLLKSQLRNNDPIIQLSVCDIFVRRGFFGDDVLTTLLKLIKNQKKEIRSGAIILLGHMGSKASIAIKQLLDTVNTENDDTTRCLALSSIGFIAREYPSALPKESFYKYLFDNSTRVRERAAEVINHISSPWSDDVIAYIINYPSESDEIKEMAFKLLSAEILATGFHHLVAHNSDFDETYSIIFKLFNFCLRRGKGFMDIIGNFPRNEEIRKTIGRFISVNSLKVEQKINDLIDQGEGQLAQHLLTWLAVFVPENARYWMKTLFS